MTVLIFSASIFLLSGLVNVVLFTTTRRILPAESMRIGKWQMAGQGIFPPDQESDHRTSPFNTHSRTASQSSSDSTVVASSLDHSGPKPSWKAKARPPDIQIRRDSIDSLYSVYDEELPGVQPNALQPPPPVSSHWSPDGSPQAR